jgi:chromate transporter
VTAELPPTSSRSGHGYAASLREVALLFLRLGTTAFGGPAAHIALMEDEVVRRRGWLSREEFLDLLGATNLIPGPNSTEMAIHIGHRVRGWLGLLTAGACFIIPATLITTFFAWAYVRYGSLPSVAGILYGVKPVIIAVVFQALWGLTRTCVKTRGLAVLGLVSLAAALAGVHELLVLFGAGILLALVRSTRKQARLFSVVAIPPLMLPAAAPAAGGGAAFGLWPLFLFFVKVGSVLFGSGYVLLAFLRADLVERYGWLTEQQLLDAVAVGQVTPGPVFTTATFIGYILAGPVGAAVATIGIFLPAFVFVAISSPLIPRLRKSEAAGAFLDGVNVSSLALMAMVTLQLSHSAIVDVPTVLVGIASAVLLVVYRVNSTWLIAGGAAVGVASVLAG